jgi:SAM-dependent methyltransferase
MADSDRDKWEQRHASGHEGNPEPARVLADYAHLLPARGRALDLACGRGGNALFLARQGLETLAWDFSAVAIESLNVAARRADLALAAEQRDVVENPPESSGFDVIVVSHFLDRGLIPKLIAALRPGGLVYYQTFLRESAAAEGPRNPAYRLGANELLELFAPLHVLAYREDGLVGDPAQGFRNEALLVAQKRAVP